jgi:hypothetical protein
MFNQYTLNYLQTIKLIKKNVKKNKYINLKYKVKRFVNSVTISDERFALQCQLVDAVDFVSDGNQYFSS